MPAGDVDALEDALFVLLADEERNEACRRNAAAVADEFRWAKVLGPIVEFCRAPRRAPDLVDPEMAALVATVPTERTRRATIFSYRHDTRVIAEHLRSGDWKSIVRKLKNRIRIALRS